MSRAASTTRPPMPGPVSGAVRRVGSSPVRAVRAVLARLRAGRDAGMSTAEYAVGTVAACGFAALLWTVLHSATVEHALSGLVTRALGML